MKESVSKLGKAAIEAHSRLQDGEGLSFYNLFKAGAEWMAEMAQEWISDNIKDYVDWEGNVDIDELKSDLQRTLAVLTDDENVKKNQNR